MEDGAAHYLRSENFESRLVLEDRLSEIRQAIE
jgi:hypothetical protein